MNIHFFSEDIEFILGDPNQHSSWINDVILSEGYLLGEINYVFTSDEYLLGLNKQHLQHDFYTDIITFDYSEGSSILSGDLFISIERVRENASSLGVTFVDELDRVMVHGVLHLMGYKDKTEKEAGEIRKKEDHCLSLRTF